MNDKKETVRIFEVILIGNVKGIRQIHLKDILEEQIEGIKVDVVEKIKEEDNE